jgi:microcystin-dependent protein
MVDFPNSPVDGDQYTENGTSWTYKSPPDVWAVTATFNAPGGFDTYIIGLIYPIGSVFISLLNVNPGTYYAGTSWVLDAADRAIVGAGGARAGGDEFGADTHTLTTAQLPSHTHSINPPSTQSDSQGTHSHQPEGWTGNFIRQGAGGPIDGVQAGGSYVGGWYTTGSTATNGAHTHWTNIGAFNSSGAGSGEAHSIVQASKAFYTWRRTA